MFYGLQAFLRQPGGAPLLSLGTPAWGLQAFLRQPGQAAPAEFAAHFLGSGLQAFLRQLGGACLA
jgi:hypothetical protein